MFFTKYPYRANFTFDGTESGVRVLAQRFAGDIIRLNAPSERWPEGDVNLLTLNLPEAVVENAIEATESGEVIVRNAAGHVILQALPGEAFGVSGKASMWQFATPEGAEFFGLGEKNFGTFELSGYRTKFWNTDVWGDFPAQQWGASPVDPPYFSTPYVAVRVGDTWIGLLLHNPYPTFIETPGMDESRVFVEWQRTASHLIVGSEDGEPNLYVILGPTLAELTRKLQKLVGVTPTPPVWALGYHQSRWGYAGRDDLLALDEQFAKHKIPCDALWMDLDYMDGYRIFTTSEASFPGGAMETATDLAKNGRRIIPIIDPGVKLDPGYAVYDDGVAQGVFAPNEEGKPFVGLVWPGETVFPDFLLTETRDWWATYTKRFREEGFGGCWIDMNDPSTGPVDPNGMRFRRGSLSHGAGHNQYALGMQMATQTGFLAAQPDERPFILSRSGYIGSSRYSAIWTGDNLSNYFYLKISIPTSLGMSISGLPFNGPDLGGFGGDITDELMVDWTKAGFLFPFLRNHCGRGQREQEPFAFPAKVMSVIRRYIRLRYKLMPYLYNLFIDQEQSGDPIMRPLPYHFDAQELTKINDQFMVGPSILQAPVIEETAKSREVTLPGTELWYDATNGQWVEPGIHRAKKSSETTPLFIPAGAIIPMTPGTPTGVPINLFEVRFHIFLPPDWSGESTYNYRADDGLTFAYRQGIRSELAVHVAVAAGNAVVSVETLSESAGPIQWGVVVHGAVKTVRVTGNDSEPVRETVSLTGKALPVLAFLES